MAAQNTVEVARAALDAALKAQGEQLLAMTASTTAETSAKSLAQFVKTHGLQTIAELNIVDTLTENMKKNGKKDAPIRAGACIAITALCNEISTGIEPFILALFAPTIDLMGDKERVVQTAATDAGQAILSLITPNAIRIIMPALLQKSQKWQSAQFRMLTVIDLAKRGPVQMARCMPDVIPFVTSQMWDLKKEVKDAAKAALLAVCDCVDNTDIKPFVPNLIKTIENPKEVKKKFCQKNFFIKYFLLIFFVCVCGHTGARNAVSPCQHNIRADCRVRGALYHLPSPRTRLL